MNAGVSQTLSAPLRSTSTRNFAREFRYFTASEPVAPCPHTAVTLTLEWGPEFRMGTCEIGRSYGLYRHRRSRQASGREHRHRALLRARRIARATDAPCLR